MKSTILAILGIAFMIISMLIMMNAKVALIVTIVLWLVLTFMSVFVRHKARENIEK